jgi:translation initiation factor 1
MKRNTSGGLVYSTESGRMCPACRMPVAVCACGKKTSPPASDGVVRVSRETKGRGGKAVTLISGLALDTDALSQLCKQLKTSCGTGGTVKAGAIELQGDRCDAAMDVIRKLGMIVKRTGG